MSPCWTLTGGLPVPCTLRTLFKTVPPLYKYWFCSNAQISELAIKQNSLCKLKPPSDRFSQRASLCRGVPGIVHTCPLLPAHRHRPLGAQRVTLPSRDRTGRLSRGRGRRILSPTGWVGGRPSSTPACVRGRRQSKMRRESRWRRSWVAGQPLALRFRGCR